MKVFARFEKCKQFDNQLFRFDTRLYFTENPKIENGQCIGAVVGKNPGSALPKLENIGVLAQLELNSDKFLPTVRNRFIEALYANKIEPKDEWYIQVWNLFYLVDKDLESAKQKIARYSSPICCPTENNSESFLWYLWGGNDDFLNTFKTRFQNVANFNFFYNNSLASIENGVPENKICARHTQGMRKKPISDFLNENISQMIGM